MSPASDLSPHYATIANAAWEIAHTYFFRANFDASRQTLDSALQLLATSPDTQPHQLHLLLLYGHMLTVAHLCTHQHADLMLSINQQALSLAQSLNEPQGTADALSLLGQAHYFANIVTNFDILLKIFNGEPPPADFRAKFNTALDYQQQALQRREVLNDTRGMSESHFQIGVIHERWQEYDTAMMHYRQARQLADQYDHAYEKAEPARHLAFHALRNGDLDQALIHALDALARREAVNFLPYQPIDHLLLRDVYLARRDLANAQHHQDRATAIAYEIGLYDYFAPRLNRPIIAPSTSN